MTAKKNANPAPADDAELDACVTDLETLKGQLQPAAGPQAAGATPAAVDPATILAIIDVVLKLIERLRSR